LKLEQRLLGLSKASLGLHVGETGLGRDRRRDAAREVDETRIVDRHRIAAPDLNISLT